MVSVTAKRKKQPPQFSDYNSAVRIMRAVVRRLEKEIDRLRPDYKYAYVVDTNIASYTATVVDDPNDPNDQPYSVQAAGGAMPVSAGQKVRIAGQRGDRYIDGVIGASLGNIRWATVSSASPFQVTLDGTTTPVSALNATPAPYPVVGQECICFMTQGLALVTAFLSASGSSWIMDRGDLDYSGTGGDSSRLGGIPGNSLLGAWEIGRSGKYCELYAVYTNVGALTPGTTGDVANKQVLQIFDPRFIPSRQTGLISDGTGRVATHVLQTSGLIYLSAVGTTATVADGESMSVGAVYKLD